MMVNHTTKTVQAISGTVKRDSHLNVTDSELTGDSSDDSDDAPPPLEDMTHMFNKLSAGVCPYPLHVDATHPVQAKAHAVVDKLDASLHHTNATEPKTVSNRISAHPASNNANRNTIAPAASNEFGGLKKGFFSTPSTAVPKIPAVRTDGCRPSKHLHVTLPKTTTPSNAEHVPSDSNSNIPFIKGTAKHGSTSNTKSNVSSPLSESIRQMFKIHSQDNGTGPAAWMTNDFWDKVQQSPNLSKAFSDASFSQAAQDLATNPQGTFEKYAKERPDFLLALKELAMIIGDHLITFADEASNASINHLQGVTSSSTDISPVSKSIVSMKPTVPDDLPDHEKDLLQRVFNDSEIQEILRDSQIQRILKQIQHNPPEIAQIMHQAPTSLVKKLHKLIECGLLQVQR
ncbi:hypothetical protein BSLG_010253 [Batrachochytrium salamandrivorans]|nr:hypothetical protein BSLG_010253 [Batrachochytrium salamandrivorans]